MDWRLQVEGSESSRTSRDSPLPRPAPAPINPTALWTPKTVPLSILECIWRGVYRNRGLVFHVGRHLSIYKIGTSSKCLCTSDAKSERMLHSDPATIRPSTSLHGVVLKLIYLDSR